MTNLSTIKNSDNVELFQTIQLSSQELIKLKGNDVFYDNVENANNFIEIVRGDTMISIRLIDYFVTKYSKYNKCCYKINEGNKETIFNIHVDYKNQLKIYQKTYFDPFSRGDRIPFFMKDTCVITTVGQLNFFKWFISKKVYNYLIEIKNNIYNEMNNNNKADKTVVVKPAKQLKIKENQYMENQKKHIILMNNTVEKDKKIVNIVVTFE
jgi:hypothetical protein